MTRNDIMIMRDDINLNEDELTLVRYLYKVVQNDPLTTGVRENLTDSFINYLLTELRLQKQPFVLNLQSGYYFQVESPQDVEISTSTQQ